MPSRPLRCSGWHVFATAAIAAATLWLSGCSTGDSSETGTASNGGGPTTRANGDAKKADTGSSADKASKEAKPVAAPPMLAGWEKPAAVIVVTGEQHGYFEPCGCTANQTGGMSRRADMI